MERERKQTGPKNFAEFNKDISKSKVGKKCSKKFFISSRNYAPNDFDETNASDKLKYTTLVKQRLDFKKPTFFSGSAS